MSETIHSNRLRALSQALAELKPDEWLTIHAPGCKLEENGCTCNSYPVHYGDLRTVAEIWSAADRYQAMN
jgi:hypothetical protein